MPHYYHKVLNWAGWGGRGFGDSLTILNKYYMGWEVLKFLCSPLSKKVARIAFIL